MSGRGDKPDEEETSGAMGGGGGGILKRTGELPPKRAGLSAPVAVEIQGQMDNAVAQALAPHQQALAPLMVASGWVGASLMRFSFVNHAFDMMERIVQTAPPALGGLFEKTTQ